MANQEHLAILAKGVEAWNQWRSRHQGLKPDLHRANLINADLSEFNLHTVDLSSADAMDADLSASDLTCADLMGASLRYANLSDADLSRADLSEADLSHANLSNAVLVGAIIRAAELNRAQLAGSVFGGTVFADLDLSTARNLRDARHQSPSTIGIDTFLRSRGQLPEPFLRGVGVQEDVIPTLPSIKGSGPTEPCFISYSEADADFADRLHDDLQANGLRCWLSSHNAYEPQDMDDLVETWLSRRGRAVVVLSISSMSGTKLKNAIVDAYRSSIASHGRKLTFIALESRTLILDCMTLDDEDGNTYYEISPDFIADFSNWKDQDSYTKAFERLMRDLKAEAAESYKEG